MEANTGGEGTWRDVVGTAECREKVVERVIVCQVDNLEPGTPLVAVCVKQVVVAERQIEQIALGNSRGIMVIVLGSRSRDGHKTGTILGRRTKAGWTDRHGGCRMYRSAVEARLKLLVRSERRDIDHAIRPVRAVGTVPSDAWHRTGH